MVTIKQVAAKAGVSFKTVSRVINKDPTVKEANRLKVEAAVKALGYRQNKAASLIRRKHSDVIGFIADEISTTPASVDILRGAQDVAWEQGKTLMVFNLDHTKPQPEKLLEECLQHRAEGVIYGAMFHQSVTLPASFLQSNTVMVNCFCPKQRFPSIVPDDEQAGYQVTKALLVKGYRRIAFLNLHPDIVAADLRAAGFKRALQEYQIGSEDYKIAHVEATIDGEFCNTTWQTSADVIKQFKPDAILCGKDMVAVRVYFVLERLGYQVGKNIGVASFDNWDEVPEVLDPGLSTMELPYYQMGRRAMERVIALDPDDKTAEKIECQLISRNSF